MPSRSVPDLRDLVPHVAALLFPLLLGLVLAAAPGLAAQDGTAGEPARTPVLAVDPDLRYSGVDGELSVRTPRLDGGIEVDARLDEPVWAEAAVLTGFTQYDPVEGIPASEETEVAVFVDAEAIHFGIVARDREPAGIRATLSQRDEVGSDDWVRIFLDTYDDRRRAFVFTVNPLGVQHDGIWQAGDDDDRGGGVDDAPDFLWESDGRITADGWTAEIRIPFKSLRFRGAEVQRWGLQVARSIQRRGFEESWAPISRDETNRLARAGTLEELRDLDPGLFLELNPVLTGRWTGEHDLAADRFVRADPEADFGLGLTYGITSNLTLDATYNPDFSQVEADAGQIAVNERFALFFPEKRPFFLEGSDVFSMPRRLVFTRTIVDPLAGWKLTGKAGRFQVGYLGAWDEGGAGDGGSLVNIARSRMDLGGSSTVGALVTDRTSGSDDYNRVAAADARLVFGGRYTLTLLGAASRTASPGVESFDGTLLSASIERSGRTFGWSAGLEDVAPDFRTRSGFIRRIGDTRVDGRIEWSRVREPGDLLEEFGFDLDLRGAWDHETFWDGGGWEEAEAELGLNLDFRNNLFVGFEVARGEFRFRPEAYEGLFVEGPGGGAGGPFRPPGSLFGDLDAARGFVFANTWERVRGRVSVDWAETPVFDRALGVPVEPAELWSGSVDLTLLPTRSFRADVGVRHETLRRADGSRYSSATIPRVGLQYQFSRALFARTIVEYGAQERAAPRDPATGRPLLFCSAGSCEPRVGDESFDFHVEGLVSYEPSPGTIFFVGYTRDMRDRGAFRFRDIEPAADGFFAKVSYLFRL